VRFGASKPAVEDKEQDIFRGIKKSLEIEKREAGLYRRWIEEWKDVIRPK